MYRREPRHQLSFEDFFLPFGGKLSGDNRWIKLADLIPWDELEGLSCTAVAQRLGLPNSSLAKWVRQARIDRGDFGPPEQGQLTSEERAELARLRKENRELRRQKDFFRLAAAHFAKEQLPPRGFV
jgi:transposase-like protein